MIKLPTDKTDNGAGTGKADVVARRRSSAKKSTSASRSPATAASSSAAAPSQVKETNGLRWGFGAGFPSRKSLRFTAEMIGEKYTKHAR